MSPQPTVRLKGDRIILKLGTEQCELKVTDGKCDDAAQLAKAIQGRIQEVLAKRSRDPERMAEWEKDWEMSAGRRTRKINQELMDQLKGQK